MRQPRLRERVEAGVGCRACVSTGGRGDDNIPGLSRVSTRNLHDGLETVVPRIIGSMRDRVLVALCAVCRREFL